MNIRFTLLNSFGRIGAIVLYPLSVVFIIVTPIDRFHDIAPAFIFLYAYFAFGTVFIVSKLLKMFRERKSKNKR